jgi:hypothetical protein
MQTQQLGPRAKQRIAALTKTCKGHIAGAHTCFVAGAAALDGGVGELADANGQLWHQAGEERMDNALNCISKMQALGASEEQLAPLWESFLANQQA